MPAASSAELTWPACRRFQALWRVKLVASVLVSLIFWTCYVFLSRHAFFPIHQFPQTNLDRWAGFRPVPWAWIYESIFLLTGIIPWLVVRLDQLRRYLTGFAVLSLCSFVVFAAFPVASPRPAAIEASPFLLFVTRIDGPLNAFPSLHAGCLIYNLKLLHRLFNGKIHPLATIVLWAWAILILFATLATKQHYAADIVAGGLLGWLADWFAWRSSARAASASAKTLRNSEVASQVGWR
jgi:membrane-associated phospholipid phosphatase